MILPRWKNKYLLSIRDILVVLWIWNPWLFSLTAQGGMGAVLPIPSATQIAFGNECIHWLNISLAESTTINGGASQPTEMDALVEKVETVTFSEDMTVVEKTIMNPMDIGNGLKSGIAENKVHDIKNFLARPVKCASGVWSTAAAQKTQLFSMEIPTHVLSDPMYRQKLSGFLGFRATTVVRLQINAERFQQGRLILHYLPIEPYLSAVRVNVANSHLTLITQQPHVDFDVSTDTEVVLRIPFINIYNYYNLLNGSGIFGRFYLTVYAPLESPSGPSDAAYMVWCSFEDVELEFPTISLQAGISSSRKGRGEPSMNEAESSGVGPISGLLSRVSKAAGILGEIPFLSSFTAPASWAADIVSRSAKAMGWSKPTYMTNANRMQSSLFPNMLNVDGVDMGQKMALCGENHIENLPGFAGTDVDEMSIASLVQRPCYIGSFQWMVSDPEATVLDYWRLDPRGLSCQSTVNNGTSNFEVTYPTPAFYLENLFYYWRGSVNFTFKVIKTEFHSGRIMFAFAPGKILDPELVTYTNSEYLYREILDLRSSNEISFSIPFVATVPYLKRFEHFGVLKAFVVNPLRAPTTVSNTVTILTEVSWGADFEVAFHRPVDVNGLRPVLYTQAGVGERSGEELRGAQIGSTPPNIGSGSVQNTGELAPARFCIGERIMSLRQLLKRFTTTFYSGFSPANDSGALNIVCFAYKLRRIISGTPFAELAPYRMDLLDYFAPMFAMGRGGERYKLTANGGSPELHFARLVPLRGYVAPTGLITPGVPPQDGTLVCAYTQKGHQAGIEVEVPAYQSTHTRSIYASYPTDVLWYNIGDESPSVLLNLGGSEAMTIANLTRAASDDFQLGFFIGTLPLLNPVPV